MPPEFDEGICVRHWDWSETSQTVAIMTRKHGMLRCLAKGSKRDKAPFSGGVELLDRAELGVILKPNADLATLTNWDLIEPMPAARVSFARHAACIYLADLLPRGVQDRDPHPGLYDAAALSLAALGGVNPAPESSIHAHLAWFQWRMLEEIGSKPEVAVDVRTGETLDPRTPNIGFAWEFGGLSALPDRRNPPAGIARIRPGTAQLLALLDTGAGVDALLGTPDATVRAGRVLAARLRHVLSAEPPSLQWVYPEIASRTET